MVEESWYTPPGETGVVGPLMCSDMKPPTALYAFRRPKPEPGVYGVRGVAVFFRRLRTCAEVIDGY